MRSLANALHRESVNWLNNANRSESLCTSARPSAAQLILITSVFTVIFNTTDALVVSPNQLLHTDVGRQQDEDGEVMENRRIVGVLT